MVPVIGIISLLLLFIFPPAGLVGVIIMFVVWRIFDYEKDNSPSAAQSRSNTNYKTDSPMNISVSNGLKCIDNEDYEQAINIFYRCINDNGDNAEAYSHLSMAYALANKYDQSYNAANKAISLNQNSYVAYISRAMVYLLDREDIQSAIKDANTAIAINDNNCLGYYYSALAYAYTGKFDEAKHMHKIVQQLNYNTAHELLGILLAAEGKYLFSDMACIVADAMINADGYKTGLVPRDMLDKAEEIYTDAVNEYKYCHRAHYGLGCIHIANNDLDSARAKYEQLKKYNSLEYAHNLFEMLNDSEATYTNESSYTTLGVSNDASESEIKKAYRNLVKVWHPDRFSHDPALQEYAQNKLKDINDAYSLLVA